MKFKFKLYQRHFKQPLRTSHGIWQIREGIIISLSNGINLVEGEIAPLAWFGSETLTAARKFCQQLGDTIDLEIIQSIPDELPACQFAFESAWVKLTEPQINLKTKKLNYCYLLPAGKKALNTWQEIYQTQQNTTFKWKIGVYPLTEELEILQQLIQALPSTVQLRLDANGGLNFTQAKKLLMATDDLTAIEFIEQPLSPNEFLPMLQLSQAYKTPLALDESVASFSQLKLAHQQGWQGIFIIKASIMGFPHRFLKYCQHHALDVVFSSVFETEIGQKIVLELAQQLNHPRAVGFGLNLFI